MNSIVEWSGPTALKAHKVPTSGNVQSVLANSTHLIIGADDG